MCYLKNTNVPLLGWSNVETWPSTAFFGEVSLRYHFMIYCLDYVLVMTCSISCFFAPPPCPHPASSPSPPPPPPCILDFRDVEDKLLVALDTDRVDWRRFREREGRITIRRKDDGATSATGQRSSEAQWRKIAARTTTSTSNLFYLCSVDAACAYEARLCGVDGS